jgi:hypothetical protein
MQKFSNDVTLPLLFDLSGFQGFEEERAEGVFGDVYGALWQGSDMN